MEEGPLVLQIADRVAGAPTSPAVDFLVPGLEGLHFVAYGSSAGSVVVGCARQLDHIGSACQDKMEQQQLEMVLVMDLHYPAATATVVTARPSTLGCVAAPAPSPLGDPVLHVAFGGGPHLLLAACSQDTLVVASLEGLAAYLFHQQTSSCGGAHTPSVKQHTRLWHQVAAVHCGHAEVLAISWTQQLDGILTSSSDGMLTMWHLRPLAAPAPHWRHEQLQVPLPPGISGAAPATEAVLRAAWSVLTPTPQRLICAGVGVYAPSATAAGRSTAAEASSSCSPGRGTQSTSCPAKGVRSTSSSSSPTRESSEDERYASIWWPQLREQRQRHYAAGMPSVGQEKLRHPVAVTGLQWSPGVLQKDVLCMATASSGSTAAAAAGASKGEAGMPDSASPTSAAIAATEAEDHPALMTLTEDRTIRVWVETLVLTESSSSLHPVRAAAAAGSAQPPFKSSPQLQRLSPSRTPGSGSKGTHPSGAGSPGAAPSSPRDVRAAAAAAAALGAAAPAITSYFCMALLIDPSTTAAGAALAAAAGATGGKPGVPGAQHGLQHVALWARHAGPLLLHKQPRRVAAPVLWLFTAALDNSATDGTSKVLLHLHAVRGLSAIVMSAGYGGSLSSTSGGSSSTRPAAVLWGRHTWDLPASTAGSGLSHLLQRLCCWVSDEEGFPLLHVFTSSSNDASCANADGSSRLFLAGRTFATVQEDDSMSIQVHKQLAVVSSWQAAAVAHVQAITAFAVSATGNSASLVASCDGTGRLLLWRGPHMQHLAAVPAAAVGSTAALVWLPLEAAAAVADGAKLQGWLAVGSGSMLQCYAISSKQAVAVATAALPAGCSGIKSLHAMKGGGGSYHLLLAVCSSSVGRGIILCGWQCSAAAGSGAGMQLQLVGTASVPFAPAEFTAAATTGNEYLLLGTVDGAVLLLAISSGSGSLQVQSLASLQEQGRVLAAAADEGCLHIAAASGSGVSIWSAGSPADTSNSNGAASCFHYVRDASLLLPVTPGHVTSIAWMNNMVVPCLAVATSSGSILVLAAVRWHGECVSNWHWVAHLPVAADDGSGAKHVTVVSGCGSVMATAGSQLLRLSDSVQLPPRDHLHSSSTQLLGRLLLESAGPLPQYHPRFLAALLLSGKYTAAAAVLQRLAAWLIALRQHEDTAKAAGEVALHHPPSPGVHVALTAAGSDGNADSSDLPAPLFSRLPLPELLDPELMQLESLLQPLPAATPAAVPGVAQLPASQQQQKQADGKLESGLLDLAAFGMAPPPAAVPPQPASGSIESGMLDLAAFGMASLPAAALPQLQPGTDSMESSMLNFAAFGNPPVAALPQQQAGAGGIDSGTLDLATFGMAPPPAAVLPQQQQQLPGSFVSAVPSSLPLATAGLAQPTRNKPSCGALLPPPKQNLLSAKQLLPVGMDCLQQLHQLLVGDSRSEDAAMVGLHTSSTNAAAVQFFSAVRAIPGLSLAETSAVLSIAERFSAAAASPASLEGSSMVDAAAAHFISAVSLACATSGNDQQPSSNGCSVSKQPQAQQPRITVMNAAGVAYTLAPSSVAGTETEENGESSRCISVGNLWGLLRGLDAMVVLWALVSGTEEQMLDQALRQLYLQESASKAAAAAAESSDAAVFLAVRTAGDSAAPDQLPTWPQLRQLGVGFWLRDQQFLASTMEKLAKQQFAERRNADDCALLYCALGKRSVLQGLYRSTQNRKLAEFLARDFGQEQHRQAAQKNAFVLLGQHRHELAAAFFVLGNCPDEAIGVAANEMHDPQLALLLCRLLFGRAGSDAESRLLRQLHRKAQSLTCSDAALAGVACCWLQAEAAPIVSLLLDANQSKLPAATAEHAAQLLPLLRLVLTAVPLLGHAQQEERQHQLVRCLQTLAITLQSCGLQALAIEAAAAAIGPSGGQRTPAQQQHIGQLLHHLVAVTLLPEVLEQQQRHSEADAADQLEVLQQHNLPLDAPVVLSLLRRMQRSMSSASQQHAVAWAPPAAGQARAAFERQQSSGGSSSRSRDSEQPRWQQQRHSTAGTAVVGDGQVLFRVDGEKLEAVACCPLMSPDVLGRPVVTASHRHGLVEGQLHVVPPELLSPLREEVPDSPAAATAALLEEEQQQRGGMFGRLLTQLFDQAGWQTDPSWHHGGAEFDVVGAAAETPGSTCSPHGSVSASSISTTVIAAHPHKQLYLSGCSSGRLHLWQFGEQNALATYTPVPGSDLANISTTFSGLLSFSRSFKQSSVAPKLANWGKATAVRFAPSGERFAAVGEGGVVATWRLDAPTRLADGDGHGCAEWWHQALSKQGCAVDFVGGSSSVLVVGGRCLASGIGSSGSSNLSVWDTMAPTATSCVGRLSHHQSTVTAVSMLPGGWLLAAGDGEGGLSCTDLRMMGGSAGPRLLWSVKASRGAVRAIDAIPSSSATGGTPLGGGTALVATAGADGAVRLWRGADGRLLQSIEGAHHSSGPTRGGSGRSSHDGGNPLTQAGGTPKGAHPLAVSGLAVCEEGLVSCGADGCVRLFSFLY